MRSFIRELLELGADPNPADRTGFPPLIARDAVVAQTPAIEEPESCRSLARIDSQQTKEILRYFSCLISAEMSARSVDSALHLLSRKPGPIHGAIVGN